MCVCVRTCVHARTHMPVLHREWNYIRMGTIYIHFAAINGYTTDKLVEYQALYMLVFLAVNTGTLLLQSLLLMGSVPDKME